MSDPLHVAHVWNELARDYDHRYTGPLELAEDKLTFSLLPNVSGKRVLDLGCGTGLALNYLHPAYYMGVDISYKMLERASYKFGDIPGYRQWHLGNMERLKDLTPGSFDVIISTYGAVNYARRLDLLRSNLWRLLKPGGMFAIMVFGKRREKAHTAASRLAAFIPPLRLWDMSLTSAGFRHLRFTGINLLVDYLPKRLSQRAYEILLFNETKLFGHHLAEHFKYQLIFGVKPNAA